MRLDLTRPLTAGLIALVIAEITAAWAVLKPVGGPVVDDDYAAQQIQGLPLVLGLIVVAAAAIFGLVAWLGRTSERRVPSRRALLTGAYVCALFGLLVLMPAFWSGLPVLLGMAAVALGGTAAATARRAGERAIAPSIAIALGVLEVLATILFSAIG